MFTIAIVGRANVGKTTLFNRIVGKKQASIVANIVGTTRDRNEVDADFFDIKAKFIDAAGIEVRNNKDTISKQMLKQALESVNKANLCLFVIDGTSGVLDSDIEVFNILRKNNKKSILLVNKAENPDKLLIDDLYKINCETKILVSAEHNLGFGDLYKVLLPEYHEWQKKQQNINNNTSSNIDIEDNNKTIRIAILGRPNAGKSTFLNNLLNEDRLLTSDITGTTRDKIELDFTYNNRKFVLIDTAGIRKKHKDGDSLELASVDKSLEALQYADVAIMIMDITTALEEQDLSLCQKICNEGRILVICFNKWDFVKKTQEQELLNELQNRIRKSIAQVKGIMFFTCSAIMDNNLTSVLDGIIQLYNKWDGKITAGQFNKKVGECSTTPNNIINTLKIKYINQVKHRPPTFIAFSGKNEKYITPQHVETLKNWLYREFDLTGIPLRVSIRGKK
ncbi:MAG: ribosome biogenesis GTPase Der [Rickettsiales bacterium]|nr:ribosome biogenesis GTPase Der [Rickettsiales bacterium]